MPAFETTASMRPEHLPPSRLTYAPLALLCLAVGLLPLFLVRTIALPIGPMFWDQYLYLDAANRIAGGQVPSLDFFTPVGALGYYLFALAAELFPNGHPLLLASWSLLFVTAPLMALVTFDLQRRSPALAVSLVLPFLLFSILPFNTGDFYPFPGSDGFGIYNRQICQLLYVLAAALVFTRNRAILAAVVMLSMLALFFVKVTGVAAGVILCLTAFAAGRLALKTAIIAGAGFIATLAALELTSRLVSAYLADIVALLEFNETSLLPRMVQAVSLNFGIVITMVALAAVLLVLGWRAMRAQLADFVGKPSLRLAAALLDQPFIWLMAFVLAGIVFESQNTGSQAFIFLWPLLLRFVADFHDEGSHRRGFFLVAGLSLAIAAPPVIAMVQKSGRAWVGAVNNLPVPSSSHLKTMGAVTIRPMMQERAERMGPHYVLFRPAFEALTEKGELASFLLYSDFDFQSLWLTTADEAIAALKAYEQQRSLRFETVMTIDFANPFAWLMDRQAPRHIAIGADPFRAVPRPDGRTGDAVAAVDVALYPTCPPTTARAKLLSLYIPFLAPGHTRITLTPCYDAFVRNALVGAAP